MAYLRRISIVLLLMLITSFAAAEEKCSLSGPAINNNLSGYLDFLATSAKKQCSVFYSSDCNSPRNTCMDFYSSLVEDNRIDMTLAFGYQDEGTRGSIHTLDRGFFNETYETLTGQCALGNRSRGACEFSDQTPSGTPQNIRVLHKTFQLTRGGAPIRVLYAITLVRSSVYVNDRDNIDRGSGEPTGQQKKYTKAAEDAFFGGIAANGNRPCEICVYYGHARAGGGPDFGPTPLKWRVENGHPNYALYKKHRPGYRKLLQSFEQSTNRPKLVGIYGCRSLPLFWDEEIAINPGQPAIKASLKKYRDTTKFILSNELSCPQNHGALIGQLFDSVVKMKCFETFDRNQQPLRQLPRALREDYRLLQ